ncbi:MAG TPA: PCYCGC motif-containing (lipo)protein [Longimicrobiales bacterium]|nr:PCYCGC motif-containing (lipo)protein [Longimicrobiales bacterium]
MITRRQALALLPLFFLQLATRRANVHPTPRPGITGANVLKASQLPEAGAKVKEIFEMVRATPQIMDGIYCYCGCDEVPEHYSLLSCYEEDGMAQACQICQGEARMAFELHKQGKNLDQIRSAIDRNFG